MSKLNNFCFLSLFLKPLFALQKQFQRGLIEAVTIIMGELKNLTTNIRLWLKYQSYITFDFCVSQTIVCHAETIWAWFNKDYTMNDLHYGWD